MGKKIAATFAKEGADVFFTYHKNKAGAEETLEKIHPSGRKGHFLQINLENISEINNLINVAYGTLSKIDILVNNAGTLTRHKEFLDISISSLKKVFAVSFKAPFLLTQAVAKKMIQNGHPGNIINISSASALIITPGLTHYESSKSALESLARGAASDLARYDIRVNVIAPGLIETNINREQRDNDIDTCNRRVNELPLRKIGRPEDIAKMALFLASDDSNWITGAVFSVDGGAKVVSPFRSETRYRTIVETVERG